MPAAHAPGTHALRSVAPPSSDTLPAGHSLQPLEVALVPTAPLWAAKNPGGQSVHVCASAAENLPGAQAMHASVLVLELCCLSDCFPAAQTRQAELLEPVAFAANLPAVHRMQTSRLFAALSSDTLPASQGVHSARPDTLFHVPSAHPAQAPSAENCPGPQATHAPPLAPSDTKPVPVVQRVQPLAPAAENPVTQSMQAVALGFGECCPALQSVQRVAFVAAAYWPAAQSMQWVGCSDVPLNLPALHPVQSEGEAEPTTDEDVPSAHGWHPSLMVRAGTVLNWPAGHSVHAPAPESEYLPASQSAQALWVATPLLGEARPAAHAIHDSCSG